jgi:hypothetical protein
MKLKKTALPHKWRLARIGDLVDPQSDRIDIEDEEEYTQVTVRMHHKGVVMRERQLGKHIGTKRQKRLHANQFIISKIDARNGAIAIVPEELEGAIAPFDFPTIEISPKVDRDFLDYYTATREFVEQCRNASIGTTNRSRVRMELFPEILIPLPPIDEQRRIADVLRDADANIAHVEAQIDAAREVKRGVMQQLFTHGLAGEGAPTQETKIGDIPQHWQIVRLRDVTSESKKRNSKQNYDNKQVLSVSNEVGFFVSDRELPEDLSRYKLVKHKYFGYNPMRLNVGSIAFREELETGMISPDYVVFRCDEKQLAPE